MRNLINEQMKSVERKVKSSLLHRNIYFTRIKEEELVVAEDEMLLERIKIFVT